MDEYCKIILIGNKVDLFKVNYLFYILINIKGKINKIYLRTLISLKI